MKSWYTEYVNEKPVSFRILKYTEDKTDWESGTDFYLIKVYEKTPSMKSKRR